MKKINLFQILQWVSDKGYTDLLDTTSNLNNSIKTEISLRNTKSFKKHEKKQMRGIK